MAEQLRVFMERARWSDRLADELGVDLTILEGREDDYSRLTTGEIAGAQVYVSYLAEITDETLDGADDLELVVRLGAGYDNVDLDACTARGIPVVHMPQVPTEGVAQATLGLLINCANNVRPYDRDFREEGWAAEGRYTGRALEASTVGVVGMGLIGSRVIELLDPFDPEIKVFDPYADPDAAADLGAELVDLDEVIETADFVTIHVPRTAETLGMLGAEDFRRMKDTAFLLNTSRGGIYPDEDLARAIREGWIAGAAVDVFENEVDASVNPLLDLSEDESHHCVFTPHSVCGTEQGGEMVFEYLSEIIGAHQAGEFPPNVLNPGAYDEAVPEDRLSPSFQLPD